MRSIIHSVVVGQMPGLTTEAAIQIGIALIAEMYLEGAEIMTGTG